MDMVAWTTCDIFLMWMRVLEIKYRTLCMLNIPAPKLTISHPSPPTLLFKKILCEWLFCLHVCFWYLWRPEKGTGSHRTDIIDSSTTWVLGIKSQIIPVLLTAEPSGACTFFFEIGSCLLCYPGCPQTLSSCITISHAYITTLTPHLLYLTIVFLLSRSQNDNLQRSMPTLQLANALQKAHVNFNIPPKGRTVPVVTWKKWRQSH